MKNANSHGEKLSEWLTRTDDDLLDEAYSVDNAEKLKKRIESEKYRRKTPFLQRPVFRGAIAAAAGLAVAVGAVFTVPALFKTDDIIAEPKTSGSFDAVTTPKTDKTAPDEPPEGGVPVQTAPPDSAVTTPKTGNLPVELPTENLRINSIDKLNYYSAVRILTDSSNSALSRLSAGGRTLYGKNSYGVSLLSADVAAEPGYDYSNENTEGPPVGQNPPTLPPDDNPDIYYYEFDPDQVFYIHNATFFRIELTDETGFLASKIGTGVVDVVISYDFIFGDAIITLKNGDRYFSCLTNGYSGGVIQFSTHKYIEGFHVVKNFEQENYQFLVSFDGDQVDYFECAVWDKGENPDGILPIVSKTYVSNEIAEYTIDELENYFNAERVPGQNWDQNKVYQWGEYPFEEDFELKLELAEFPDTVFIWRENTIYAYENGQERGLVEGMPLLNAYFTDLNGDGYPELCTTVAFGSGIVDEHIIVYDYHNDKAYTLWDRMEFDYILFSEDGELYVMKLSYDRDSRYGDSEAVVGGLAIENGELIMKP